jgi:tetratricopeptide (TPR) repeat protein
VEQQRACTQLGRTYLELYEAKERLSGLTDAKAYFTTALELAERLRTDSVESQRSPSGFVVEHVDAYNNLGLSRAMAEDYKQALKLYSAGLKLCDEEEVDENDAARSRIHHNLGRLYTELRSWEKAKYHIELDIEICQKIPHAQGEAKGLMNLADLYFKSQDYEQVARCYKRALHIAQTLEDEDALCSHIKSNMEVLGQAKAKTKEFDVDMQKLSKLRREVESSKGTAAERRYIKQESALLLVLTNRAEELQSWEVVCT